MTDKENYDLEAVLKISDGETLRLMARFLEDHDMPVAAARMRVIAAKLDWLEGQDKRAPRK
jgi:hypothetical protein